MRQLMFAGIVSACFVISTGSANAADQAAAGGSIAGVVVDEDGAPAAGAEVTIVDLRRRTAAGGDGRFLFERVPAGEHLLEAFSSDKGSGVARVETVNGQITEATVTLEISHVRDSVVVSAGAEARSLLELARPASVLDGDNLAIRMQSSLGETLAQEPGVSSTFFGPGASRPVIRGLGGDRVRMLQGGLDSGDVSSTSPDHAVSADPLSADRIEILRGPATLLYGSSAIGGVVNVLDERIPNYPASSPLSGSVELRGGSAADERTGAVRLDGGGGSWAWHLGGVERETDDYEIPGFAESAILRASEEHEGEGHEEAEEVFGRVPNSDLESTSVDAGMSFFLGDTGMIGVSLSGFDSQYGLPGGHGHGHEGEEGEEEEEVARIDLERRRFDLKAESNRAFGAFRGLRARVGVVDYEHVELEGAEVGTRFASDSYEGRFELVQKARGPWTGSLGLQLLSRELEAVGEEAFIPPAESESWAVFAFQEVEVGNLAYQFGGRFETTDVATSASALPDRSFDGLSASVGMVWTPEEAYSIGVSLARSVKSPNAEELYASGLHVATQAFEIGDPDLGKESSLGVDVALRKRTGRLTGELSFFYNRFSDFIFQAFTGEELEGAPVVAYTQDDANFYGAELKARFGLVEGEHHHLDLELSSDFVRAELAGSGDALPRIPARRHGIGLHYHGGPLQGLIEARHVAEQDRVADNELPTDSYTLLNATLGYRFAIGDRVLDVLLRGTNLTDEDARNHTSFLKDTVPLPGRDVGLALRFWF